MTSLHRDLVARIDPDERLAACCTLARVDHVDAHLLQIPSTALSPQEWAREILEGTSAAMRIRLRAGWTMLGIGLHHGEPDTVAGWPIAHRSSEYLRLQGHSLLGLTGQLITRVTEDGVMFATFAQLGNPVAKAVWARVLPSHLAIVTALLEGAVERVG